MNEIILSVKIFSSNWSFYYLSIHRINRQISKREMLASHPLTHSFNASNYI